MRKEDLRDQIRRMEQELLSEEFREDMEETDTWEEYGPGRAMFTDEDYCPSREERSGKNANTRGLKYLLLLEILGILALIGWWIRWLI